MVDLSKPEREQGHDQDGGFPISATLRDALNGVARVSAWVPGACPDRIREILLQRGWVEVKNKRPRLTAAGRNALRRDKLAREEQSLMQSSKESEEMSVQYEVSPGQTQLSLLSHRTAPHISRKDESPLLQLAARKRSDGSNYLGPSQVEAGERLRRDFERGQITPALGINWQRIGETEGAVSRNARTATADRDLGEGALDAQARFRKAVKSVGEELADPLIDFCCFLKGLEELERDRYWPARSAKLVMSLALSQLARHYGLTDEARGPERNPFRHWGADDYRPNLS